MAQPLLLRLASGAALLAAACGALSPTRPLPPAARAAYEVSAIASRGSPTLEEIFSVPGPHGTPPRARSLSADGRALLFEWSPVETGGDGSRNAEDPQLRLLTLHPEELGDGRGRPLVELLPQVPRDVAADVDGQESAGDLVHAWSRGAARLAVARGAELYLVELRDDWSWTVSTLHAPAEADLEPTASGDGRPAALGEIRRLRFSADDRELLVWTGGELFAFDPDGAEAGFESARHVSAPLARGLRGVRWSEDLSVAFRADGGLRPTPALATAEEDGGSGEAAQVLHLADSTGVELEGFAGLEGRGRESLSPDGRFVFATSVERDGQPERNLVPDYLTERVSTRTTRRERADDVAQPTELHLWDTRSGARTSLAFQGPQQDWIRPIGWAPQPDAGAPARLAVVRTSADFRRRDVWCWDAEQGWRRLAREHDSFWVGGPAGGPRWSGDGRVLLLPSETIEGTTTPGRCQLFALHPEDASSVQLTEVDGELDDLATTRSGGVAFTASGSDPARREVHWLDGRAVGGRPLRLPGESPSSPGAGSFDIERGARERTHFERPLASDDGSTIVVQASGLGLPPELRAVRGPTGRRTLTATTPAEFGAQDWILPQRLRVAARDGTVVSSHVYLPRTSSLGRGDRPRACIVFAHGAGYLQNVTDSMTEYAVNLMFHSRLARMGYVVLDVDYRGSKGYGGAFRGAVQGRLGELELNDVHDTLDVLAERGVIDPERIGIYGGSYGGFLTLMALFTAPERWSAGAALRSVTDWRSYHPGYTQPRLGRPSTHPEAYARSSPIDLFEGLEDPLLILHGMVDANVFAQDSIRLMEELIDSGLDFEAMLYPSQGHGFVDGPHWIDEYGRIERFLIGHLGAP